MKISISSEPPTKGSIPPINLVAAAVVAFAAVMSLLVMPFEAGVVADMRISPTSKTLVLGESFTVEVIVESTTPVNVFAGKLAFDAQTLQVESIDYNTSIADLWAEEPWYSNGDGTLTFAGGTTKSGGFTGTDSLIQINFKTIREGTGKLAIEDAQVLKHDGFGTDAELAKPIDALFTVEASASPTALSNLLQKTSVPASYAVVQVPPTTDLNNDGRQSIADTSIMLLNMGSNDPRFDFNLDGKINLADFNILISAR